MIRPGSNEHYDETHQYYVYILQGHSEMVCWVSSHDRDFSDTVMDFPALRRKIDALLQV